MSPIDSYWAPSQPEIDDLERRLPRFLGTSGAAPSRPLHEYYRQYAGVVSNGRKLIYAGLLHESTFEDPTDFPDWRSEAVIMCDGGDYAWGVAFDPKTRTFQPPEFNGEI